jgi:hypothetical protein
VASPRSQELEYKKHENRSVQSSNSEKHMKLEDIDGKSIIRQGDNVKIFASSMFFSKEIRRF